MRRVASRARGSQILELALMIPIIIFLILAVVDAGRIALAYTSLQDATAATARAVARTGVTGAAGSGQIVGVPCPESAESLPTSKVALYSFCSSVEVNPFLSNPEITTMYPSKLCTARATDPDPYVRVQAEATPSLVGLWSGVVESIGWKVTADAIARCEVARRTL